MKFFRNMYSKKRKALKTFVYNECSEVVSATLGTNEYTYSYDPIGNRTASTQNAEAKSYISNPLNQYIAIQQEEQTAAPTYDADGNMLSSPSGWSFTWNAENRLVSASRGGAVVHYTYDAFGRMISKQIISAENKIITYTWDVFNIIKETENSNATYNIWGLDVDGTMQGAGGVGGLLAVAKSGSFYTPTYDANGNITEYVSANGDVVAQYQYSAFGEIISQSGESFTHRFSTKPYCTTTGLIEYQFRKYDPALGRWLSRDPIEEAGGLNLYAFCGNSIMGVDVFGLQCNKNLLITVGDSLTYGSTGWENRNNEIYPGYLSYLVEFNGFQNPIMVGKNGVRMDEVVLDLKKIEFCKLECGCPDKIVMIVFIGMNDALRFINNTTNPQQRLKDVKEASLNNWNKLLNELNLLGQSIENKFSKCPNTQKHLFLISIPYISSTPKSKYKNYVTQINQTINYINTNQNIDGLNGFSDWEIHKVSTNIENKEGLNFKHTPNDDGVHFIESNCSMENLADYIKKSIER